MILSDREIFLAVERGLIGVDPLAPFGDKKWTSTALDLTLDDELRPWRAIRSIGADNTIDPTGENFNSNALINAHTSPVTCAGGFVIGPNELVLGWTVECVWLPHQSKIGARVEGKSSLARIGLGIHVTAPTIHPGFGTGVRKGKRKGSPIRLEIWNCGPLSIKLTKSMAICQLIFEEVHGVPLQGYEGQFKIQGPETDPKRPKKR